MVIFLLLSVPLWFFFINTFFLNEGIRKRDFLIPLGKGAVIYVIALLLSWLFTARLTLGEVTPLNLYFYDLRYYNGLTVIIWLLLYTGVGIIGRRGVNGYPVREIILFLSALFLGDSLYRLFIMESWYGIYELFLLPLDNMGLINILALLLLRADAGSLGRKLIMTALSVVAVLVYNIVPVLFSFNYPFLAILSGLILFAVTFFLFFKEVRGDLGGSSFRYVKRDS